MKTIVSILSIVSLIIIATFFIVQVFVIKNNVIMSDTLQVIFGIGLLIVSICIFVFLIVTVFSGKSFLLFMRA